MITELFLISVAGLTYIAAFLLWNKHLNKRAEEDIERQILMYRYHESLEEEK